MYRTATRKRKGVAGLFRHAQAAAIGHRPRILKKKGRGGTKPPKTSLPSLGRERDEHERREYNGGFESPLLVSSFAWPCCSCSWSSSSSSSDVKACVNMKPSRRSESEGMPPFFPRRATEAARYFWRHKRDKTHTVVGEQHKHLVSGRCLVRRHERGSTWAREPCKKQQQQQHRHGMCLPFLRRLDSNT